MHTSDTHHSSYRLVNLRCLSLPAGLDVDTTNLAVICTRLTRLESVGRLRSSTATTVDFEKLKQLRHIGPGMFMRCETLTTISLRGLSQLITVRYYFLAECTSLTTVDLSALSQLTTAGHSCLDGCSSLTTVDISGLSNLTKVGDDFLRECTSAVCSAAAAKPFCICSNVQLFGLSVSL